MTNKRFLTIHFTDGSQLTITFPKQGGDLHQVADRVQKALDANQLALEIDGQLYVIPMNNIKYIQLSPSPDKLPEMVIRDGELKIGF